MRILKTGDPCPCCGKPIKLTDPDALQLLAVVADMMGLPEQPSPAADGDDDYTAKLQRHNLEYH